MPPANRRDAQQQADRLRTFQSVLADLERDGVLPLSPEQRDRVHQHCATTIRDLSARYDIDSTDALKQVSWGLRIVSTLGGLALATAVVLFFLRYWGLMSTGVQVAVLIAAPIVLLFAVEFAARREPSLYFAGLLSLVAIAAFIQDLAALGAIFNMTSTQNALLAWGAFCLLLAYRYGLRIPLFLGLGFVICWLSALAVVRFGVPWESFGSRPEVVIAAGALMLWLGCRDRHFGFDDFPAVYRLAGAIALFFSIFILSVAGNSTFLPFTTRNVERLYDVLGLIAAGALIWMGIRRHWDGLVNTASAFFVVFVLKRLHGLLWDTLPKYAYFAIVGAIAIGLVFAFLRIRQRLKLSEEAA